LRGQYLDAAEPDHEFFFGEGAETGHATPHRIDYVEHLIGSGRKRNELKESRKKSSPEAQTESPHLLARSSSAQSPSRNLLNDKDESGHEDDSDDGSPLPLFTRRDIPDESEDPDVHDLLMCLWQRRKEASEHLVEAMEQDDMESFGELELQVRLLNRQMFKSKTHYEKQKKLKQANDLYLKRSATKYVGIDELPLGGKAPKQSPNPDDTDDFKIVMAYQGNQVFRTAHPRTLNRVIYHVAQQYLRDVFAMRVDNLSSLLLLHKGEILSLVGKLADVPVENGDEIVVINLMQEDTIEKDKHVPQRHQRDHPDPEAFDGDYENHHGAGTHPMRNQVGDSGGRFTSRGDQAGHQWEESHPLQSARAPSQPGNNGGAITPRGDQAGHQWEESHPLQSARAPSQPGNNGGAITLSENQSTKKALLYDNRLSSPNFDKGAISKSFDKIRQSFKCPRFSGQTKEWKTWNKGFMRYLSIWELEHVLQPGFLDELPLGPEGLRDNKMVYYIIEDSVQSSPLAASYVRQAPMNNGFEAYYILHDGFVFAGTTTSTLLLNDLSNFRFLPDETPTALCMRLEELFEELELLPGDAAITFNDTQRIGYLINALRHEKEWDTVTSAITSAQIKGGMSFRGACNELRYRCEASRAHELMDKPIRGKKIRGMAGKLQANDEAESVEELSDKMFTLLSTMSKRHNLTGDKATPAGDDKTTGRKKYVNQPCLADNCTEETRFSLCGVHYHSLISAKIQTLKLRNGYGDATYDATTNLIVYPVRTPTDRLPSNAPRKVKAGLAGAV
jgi:hypothetical protein